jgi:hypothetical protein
MGQADALGEWKFSTMASGAGFAMITGTCVKLRWCAGSWAVDVLLKPQLRQNLVMAKASFCWMILTVPEVRVFWGSVLMLAGTCITVVPEKMPVSSVQVKAFEGAHLIIKIVSPPTPLSHM